MDIQIDGLLRSLMGDLFRQEDADLAEIFFLNVITKRVYTEYCEKFSGAKPTQIMIRGPATHRAQRYRSRAGPSTSNVLVKQTTREELDR